VGLVLSLDEPTQAEDVKTALDAKLPYVKDLLELARAQAACEAARILAEMLGGVVQVCIYVQDGAEPGLKQVRIHVDRVG
jgi:hypothetical protein